MQKSVLLDAIQQEIRRHDFSTFINELPSIAEGGKGVVVPGCPTTCKKRINTVSQFLDHLASDAVPALSFSITKNNVYGNILRQMGRREFVSAITGYS